MNETLHRILTAAAALEIKFGKDGYNAGSIARELGNDISAYAIMDITRANARLITEGKKSGCYTLTAAGREALSAPVQTSAAPVEVAPILTYGSTDYRRIVDSQKMLPVGSTFTSGGRTMIVTAHSESNWYLSHNRIEAEGLWHLDGCAVTYEYYRPAPVTAPVEAVAITVAPVVEVAADLSIEAAAELVINQTRGQRLVSVTSSEGAALLYKRPGVLGADLVRVYALGGGLIGVQTITLDGSGGGWRTVLLADLPVAVRSTIEAAL